MEHGQTLAQAARSGATLTGEFVVDCHMHNARVAKFFSRFEHYRDLITQMNRIGVTCGVVSNLWTTGEHWQAYPEMLAMCETYPGRFWGYLAQIRIGTITAQRWKSLPLALVFAV